MATGEQILALYVGGDDAGASALLEAGWPTPFFDLSRAQTALATAPNSALSNTSIALAVGSVELTLTVPRGTVLGTPVTLMDAADATRFGHGTCTVAETAGGTMTVLLDFVKNPATKTSWRVFFGLVIVTGLTAIATQSEGGTGYDTTTFPGQAAARSDLEVGWVIPVRGFDQTTPANVNLFTNGDLFHIAASGATGAFVGHEDEIAIKNGTDSFTFLSSTAYRDGDLAIEGGFGVSGSDLERRYWNSDSSAWRPVEPPAGWTHTVVPISIGISVSELTPRLLTYKLQNTITLTLPDPADWGSNLPEIVIVSDDASVKTINVSGGHNINGLSSATIDGQYAYVRVIVDTGGDEYIIVGSG